jgi:predicted N-formylglutamate amidohydrolase
MAEAQAPDHFEAVERIDGRPEAGVLLLCDHASNAVPRSYGTLGLPAADLAAHIAYDIGAADLTRQLAARLGAPALLSRFSRLLIDPNRGAEDPTLVMRLSDRRLIPGNARIDADEIDRRRRRYWQPYRTAIAETIAALSAQGSHPAIVSVHTFTPVWHGAARPWQVGILWDADPRLPRPLIAALKARGLTVGDNEPYDGALPGDTLHEQVTLRGLAGLLIEVRQDLVATLEQTQAWADLLAESLTPILARPEMHEIRFGPSRAGPRLGEMAIDCAQ